MNRPLMLLLLLIAYHAGFAQQTAPIRPSEIDSAIVAYNAKDFPKAKEWALKATAINGNLREAWEVLGFSAQALNDLPTVVSAGSRLTQIVPNERNGWYLQFIGFYRQERLDLALAPMRELCKIDPATCASSNIGLILKQISQDSLGILDSAFKTPDGSVQTTLPKSWNSTVRDDGKTMNWFVTLEPIKSDSDAFSVGATMRWVRAMTGSFVIEEKNNNAPFLVDFWDQFIAAQMMGFTPHRRMLVDSLPISSGAWSGFVRTLDFQFKPEYPVQRRIEAILARKDEVFTYTFECDFPRWSVYEPRFRKAIVSMILPK
jgi:tetratricopeptide (TPR) repeat protein